MLPILLGYYSPHGAVLVSPLFFGIAHFHHMIERIRKGQDLQTAFFISSFQVQLQSDYDFQLTFQNVLVFHIIQEPQLQGIIFQAIYELLNYLKTDELRN
jgi:prenyl protein peptidase